MTTRRQLRFDTLDDAVRDAEVLLAKGYDKLGKWDLAQCCGHLSIWMKYQIDGFPKAPIMLRPVFWMIRQTIGPRLAKKMLAGGTMKVGLPTIPQSVPQPGLAGAEAVADLKSTAEKWLNYDGYLHPSPLMGKLTREEWLQVHRIHAAHHLSFLVPRGEGERGASAP